MASSTSMSGYFDSPASSSSRLSHLQPQRSSHFSHTSPMASSGLSPNRSPRHSYTPGATGHAGHNTHSPGNVFSLVHPHERIQVPVPPSLRLRKPNLVHNNTAVARTSSWYDNDEFNGRSIGTGSSSLHLDLDGHGHKQYVEDAASDYSPGLLSRPSLIHSDSSESSGSSGSFVPGSNGGGFYPLSSQGSPYPTSRPLPIPDIHYINHSTHSGHSTPSASPTASPRPQGRFLVLPLPTH